MAAKKRVKADKGRIKVLVVDDHSIVREGLTLYMKETPDLEVVAEAEDTAGALKAIKKSKPDIVIVDLSLGDQGGLELIKDIKTRYPKLPSLVLSMHEEMQYAERCLLAGAKGYVMKNEDTEKVMEGIRQVFAGNIYLSKRATSLMLHKAVGDRGDVADTPIDCLTDRELQVFRMIGQGYSTRLIAKMLHISAATVRHYRASIREKLSLKHSSELLQYAIRWMMDSDKT